MTRNKSNVFKKKKARFEDLTPTILYVPIYGGVGGIAVSLMKHKISRKKIKTTNKGVGKRGWMGGLLVVPSWREIYWK